MKLHWQEPFDDLNNVTKLIKLYKEDVSFKELAYFFSTSENVIKNTLLYHKVLKRTLPKPQEKGKYDHLIFEPVNQGKNYSDLLKEQGIVIPQNTSFDRIRRFKEKK